MESKDQGVWPDGAAYCHVSLDLSASTSERPQRSGMTQAPGDLIRWGNVPAVTWGRKQDKHWELLVLLHWKLRLT